jgi:GntR family transcriptional regulator
MVEYLYVTVANDIEERINDGRLPPDAPLPNERHLAAEHRVSLGTVRRATEILRERGLVVTLRSKGTYVAAREPSTTRLRVVGTQRDGGSCVPAQVVLGHRAND